MRFYCVCLILLSGLCALSGCHFSDKRIADLLKNPRVYDGKVVSISGEVVDRGAYLVVRCFTVKDSTGEMLVVTKGVLPSIGAKIRVRGRLQTAFALGREQLVVLIEEEPT